MKCKIKIITSSCFIIILMVAVILGKQYYDKQNKLIYLRMTKIAKLYTNEKLPGTWWGTVYSSKNGYTRDYNIKLPKINFTKNKLILSGGREIMQITYTKGQRRLPYRGHPYIGTAIFKKKLYSHTIFVYKIKNIPIQYDDIRWPKVEIVK